MTVVSKLFEAEPQLAELIGQEIHQLSTALNSYAVHQHEAPASDSNDELGTIYRRHAAVALPAAPTSNLVIPKPGSSRRQECLEPQIHSSILIENETSASNTRPQQGQLPSTPEIPNDHVRENESDRAASDNALPQPSSHGHVHDTERPQIASPVPDRQSPSPVSSPLSEPPPSLPHRPSPPRSPRPQRPSVAQANRSIIHEMQDGIVCLRPTAEQWLEFPRLLQRAHDLDVDGVGIFKVVLPESVAGPSKPIPRTKKKGFCFSPHPQDNGTFRMERTIGQIPSQTSPEPPSISSKVEAVQRFEELLHEKSGWKDVWYCTDMDARTLQDRESFGLPTSPIWPLKGNRLPETRRSIPGIHWPYFYEAGSFGAPFTMHREDADLYSVNYLWQGDKYWHAVLPSQCSDMEKSSKETNGSYYPWVCTQFLRHSATHYLTSTLARWGVSYKTIHQKAGEVIITAPETYHQGFSGGYAFAEASNYAHQGWSIQGYRGCDPRCCPKGSITNDMLELRDEGDEQHSDGSNHMASSPDDELRTRSAPRKGKSSSRKSQSTTMADNRAPVRTKGIKRKLIDQDNPQRTLKTNRSSATPALFKELAPIPKSMVQPTDIHKIFSARSEGVGPDTLGSLTRLFFAVGSPDALFQLRDACSASRQIGDFVFPQSTNNVSDALQALDQLDITVTTASILRRFCLTFLVAQRHQRENHHKARRPKRVSQAMTDHLERANTQALTEMMSEAYPTLNPTRKRNTGRSDEYQRKLSSLKCRLRDGRNWHTMQERLRIGILALVPTHGDYQIQNREYVSLTPF